MTVLGAGAYVPAPEHSPSGYLLRGPGAAILFDCGPGTANRAAAARATATRGSGRGLHSGESRR